MPPKEPTSSPYTLERDAISSEVDRAYRKRIIDEARKRLGSELQALSDEELVAIMDAEKSSDAATHTLSPEDLKMDDLDRALAERLGYGT